MTELNQYVEQVWSDAGKAWGCVENKRQIASKRIQKILEELDTLGIGTPERDAKAVEKYIWSDFRIRAKWASRFLRFQLAPNIQRTFDLLPGSYKLPKWEVIRCRTPVSFSEMPSNEARALETSFSPNDEKLRDDTQPQDEQLSALFTALISDSYKICGAGMNLDQKVQALKSQYPEHEKFFKFWTRFVALGVNYLSYGRGCFGETEIGLSRIIDEYQGRRFEAAYDEISSKYGETNNDALVAEGGLFILNTELLPPTDAAKLEADPVEFRT